MKKVFVVGLVYCLWSMAAFAQAPAAAGKLSGVKLLEWETEVAANAYALKTTDRNKADYVAALEKLTATVCMPKYFENLTFEGNPTDEKCKKLLERLFEVDKPNPIAVCIRDGVRSPACVSAFSGQVVDVFNSYSSGSSMTQEDRNSLGLAFKLEQERAAPNLTKYWQELSSLEAGAAGKSAEEMKEFRSKTLKPLYSKLLKDSCRVSRLNYETRKVSAPGPLFNLGPTPTPGADDNAKQILDRLEHAYKKPTPVPAKDETQMLRRIRYISDSCKRAAEAVRARDPQNAMAMCMVYGPYSPQCLVALTYERQAVVSNAKGSSSVTVKTGLKSKDTQGLEEF